MPILSNRQLWEMGVPLNRAWLELASAEAKHRHAALPTFLQFTEQSNPAEIASLPEFIGRWSREWSKRIVLEKELRDSLVDKLFNDQFQAFGYRISPSRSHAPVRIAPELFDGAKVDFERRLIRARGCDYIEITIVDPTRVFNFRPKRTGRKGSADAIRKAIKALQNERFDLCGIERKIACELIRNKIGPNYPKGSGLSDVNLAKYILEVCPQRRIR